jgi:hypothetical protein
MFIIYFAELKASSWTWKQLVVSFSRMSPREVEYTADVENYHHGIISQSGKYSVMECIADRKNAMGKQVGLGNVTYIWRNVTLRNYMD